MTLGLRGRQGWFAGVALGALVLMSVSVSVAPAARSTPLPYPVDVGNECYSYTPSTAHVPGVDSDAPVSVDLFLVLDRGVSEKRARKVVEGAEESYAPLGIRLRVAGVRTAVLKGTDAQELIDQTARLFPAAQRPRGTDAVATLTSVDLSVAGSDIVGMADCRGGVRHPGRSFLVGEVPNRPEGAWGIPGARFSGITAAKMLAHELGHLLGASHSYNCVEGAASGAGKGEVSPCTLMSSLGGLDSMNFGTAEGAIVRGYAEQYARP